MKLWLLIAEKNFSGEWQLKFLLIFICGKELKHLNLRYAENSF